MERLVIAHLCHDGSERLDEGGVGHEVGVDHIKRAVWTCTLHQGCLNTERTYLHLCTWSSILKCRAECKHDVGGSAAVAWSDQGK